MLKFVVRPAALAAAVFLAACGGGGDGGASSAATTPATNPAPPTPPAATFTGNFAGTLRGQTPGTQATNFQLLALDNGEFWALYGIVNSAGAFLVSGFVEGNGVVSGNNFTSTNLRDFGTRPATAGTFNVGFTDNTVAGTVTFPKNTIEISGARPPQGYVYDTPAVLARVAGNWSTVSLAGAPTTFVIAADGSISGGSGACTLSGHASPRGQKNVFDVSVTFGPTPCTVSGQTASGIAVEFTLSTGQQQLLVTLIDSDRALGTAVFGVR